MVIVFLSGFVFVEYRFWTE